MKYTNLDFPCFQNADRNFDYFADNYYFHVDSYFRAETYFCVGNYFSYAEHYFTLQMIIISPIRVV